MESWEKKYKIMEENALTLAARIDKAVKNAKLKIKGYNETINMLIYSSVESKRYEIAELKCRIREQEDLIDILEGRDFNASTVRESKKE